MKYAPRLDGLRGVAILMVLLEHFADFLGRPISAGFYGVNLFFVLSGFLITSILINSVNTSFGKALKNFLARRSLRIFPIYYLTIAVLCLINTPNVFERLPYLLTYTYNYQLAYLDFPNDPFRPFWSLAVEEQFYLFFPFVILGLRGKYHYLILVCTLIYLVACSQLLFDVFGLIKYNYVSLLTNMAPLSMGAIGAIILKYRPAYLKVVNFKFGDAVVLLLILITSISFSLNNQIVLWSLLNLYLVVAAYTSSFQIGWFDSLLQHKKLMYIGSISYGIYLYHNLVGYYCSEYLFNPVWSSIDFSKLNTLSKIEFHSWVFKLPVYTMLTIAIASVSYKYIERPLLLLKEKFK